MKRRTFLTGLLAALPLIGLRGKAESKPHLFTVPRGVEHVTVSMSGHGGGSEGASGGGSGAYPALWTGVSDLRHP